MITVQRLKECFEYNPETGLFKSLLTRNKLKAGSIIGNKANSNHDYILIGIDGKQYYAHRLAWLYMTGEWSSKQIDHINCKSLDNRFINLREATHSENSRNRGKNKNNTTGVKGVHKNKDGYMVRICIGTYKSLEEAKCVYEEAVKLYHGKFARME